MSSIEQICAGACNSSGLRELLPARLGRRSSITDPAAEIVRPPPLPGRAVARRGHRVSKSAAPG